MDKLESQARALVQYFNDACKPEGKLAIRLTVEHFIVGLDKASTPASFDTVQNLMRVMQHTTDESVMVDGLYMGYYNPQYEVSLGASGQLQLTIKPCTTVAEMMDIYEGFYRWLCTNLAARELRAYNVGFHPLRKAEELPLVPQKRYELMDSYFKATGGHGTHAMRATAMIRTTIDYFSEKDFITKYRVACLIAPLLALLTDNAPYYQAKGSRCYSAHTHVFGDADPDRFGTPPFLFDEGFGFETYAKYALTKPLIAARHGINTTSAGQKSAQEEYGETLTRPEIEQILSMLLFDARLREGIEICAADSMPPRYITAYVQLIRTIFSSPAALHGIERHYADVSVLDIETAKLAICCNGYDAQAYGRPVRDELYWLLAQARSRIPTPEERNMLAPLITLITNRKTVWETEHYV